MPGVEIKGSNWWYSHC